MLTISAMALMLVFSIGSRATETGFRLGRSALSQADRAVALDALRVVIDGLVITPSGIAPDVLRATAIYGTPDRLQGDAVLARSTACSGAGPARSVTIEIRRLDAGSEVICSLGQTEPVILLSMEVPLAFSYSLDGVNWSPNWTNADETSSTSEDFNTILRDRRLLVRLAAPDGRFELISAARSGRPQLFTSRLRDIEL